MSSSLDTSSSESASTADNDTANATSIVHLPDELTLYISSFLPSFPFPCELDPADFTLENWLACEADWRSVRALSQTCRRLRDTLSFLSWEKIRLMSIFASTAVFTAFSLYRAYTVLRIGGLTEVLASAIEVLH